MNLSKNEIFGRKRFLYFLLPFEEEEKDPRQDFSKSCVAVKGIVLTPIGI